MQEVETLDPEEFIGPYKEIEDLICKICLTSVVINPVECKNCENFSCQKCAEVV